ncbi:uncharacterized protein BDW43DRAFT_186907 [Aspergillus alliaceus]|uniref:uncharacterized protein n=1 Tax=Petromyces alliaceus TaxID=209559 RepID=UPI0012A4BFBC|nr:uncharacterized protein BDW43DRAFT_186907 [Aspergillus alliaceus]KAB8229588.1 hypothetical protein BDW43DRAFT_186907 [Aspergillus alliaceus]
MSDVIDDETVWFPKGQTMSKTNLNKAARRPSAADGDSDNDDDTVFGLGNADMGSLNRYLHGGRVLPLDRTNYCNQTGIVDTSLITPKIWNKVDELIEAYKRVHADCTGFLGDDNTAVKQWTVGQKALKSQRSTDDDDSDFDKLCTWDKMNGLAQKIYNYSDDAGSTDAEDSYYVVMLKLCGDYNDTDDAAEQEQIRGNIKDITDDLLADVNIILSRIDKVKSALEAFDKSCQSNQFTLEGLETSMTTILTTELGNIEDLEAQIQAHQDDIKGYQAIIDQDRFDQKMTAAYVWIPIAGTIAGPIVFAQKQSEINEYEAKIDAMNKLIQDEHASVLLHKTLQANVTSMKGQAKELSGLIGPAIATIEALKGGWDVMGTQVKYINDKAASFEEKIPKMALSQLKLNRISNEWLKLNKYVTSYIQTAQMVPQVNVTDLNDYLQQLKDAAKSS